VIVIQIQQVFYHNIIIRLQKENDFQQLYLSILQNYA